MSVATAEPRGTKGKQQIELVSVADTGLRRGGGNPSLSRGREPLRSSGPMKQDSYQIDFESHRRLVELSRRLGTSKAHLIRQGIDLVFEQNRPLILDIIASESPTATAAHSQEADDAAVVSS
jgi:predicted DNA-binding protein